MKQTLDKDIQIKRKPAWLKVKLPSGDNFQDIKKQMRKKNLFTVCEEASCPNIGECWSARTATIMILGDTCTRACKFCNVKTGNPKKFVNKDEIDKAGEMALLMNLKYIVITSVDRDDLPDYGAEHFANVVKEVHKVKPETKVEVLIPDFNLDEKSMNKLAQSNPLVIAQNIETVERLTYPVRDRRAGYEKTLKALEFYKINYPHIYTKTSIMVGLGETKEEVIKCMQDLRKINVDIITFGQYLQPTKRLLPVVKYYHPDEFKEFKEKAYSMNFKFVASGPLVRSSYKAGDFMNFLESQGHHV
jgi:lipoyl synthase